MDGMSSTSIPCKGDRKFAMFMKTLAARKDTSVAVLVRQALELIYGDELQSIEAFFAAEDDASKHETMSKHTHKDWAWVDPTMAETAATGKARNG